MSVPCKYPAAQGLFFFDHTPSHMKCPKDALDADRMNVKDGGKQPFMRDTVWNGHVRKMVTSEGLQKEMKSVLQERRVDTSRINAEKLRELLHQYEVWILYIIIVTSFNLLYINPCVSLKISSCYLFS